MTKSTHEPAYEQIKAKLVNLRKEAGLTTRSLAHRLGREHSFVTRVEQGERRLDLLEFMWFCQACGASPEKVAAELMRQMGALERKRRKSNK